MTRVVKNPSGYRSKGRDGVEKAQCFGVYAKQHGWTGKYHLDEDTGIVYLFARRGENETIEIWWTREGKALPRPDLPVYTLAGERIKVLNVSAIAAIAAKTPDENRLRKAVKKQKRQLGVGDDKQMTAEDIAALRVSLPFDHESSDDELKDVLIGRTITWVNRMSGDTETAEISTDPKHFHVRRNGHDYIDFVRPIPQRVLANFGKSHMESDTYGFRSVYLDSIVGVE